MNGLARPAFGELDQGIFNFSDQDRIESRLKIFRHMIGRIRTVRGDGDASNTCRGGHRECKFAVAPETHFGNKVKVVFAHNGQSRMMSFQRSRKPIARGVEGGVKQRDGESALAQRGGSQ